MGVYDIQGLNCVFQLKIGDEYFTVVCAKSFTFNPVTDMKETTTVGSGFWKEFRPRKLSYTITFNGMFQVVSLVTQEKIKTMFDYQIQFLPLSYRMIYTDNSGNVMVVNGTSYVTSTLLDASPVNLVNGTVELQGTGPIEILDEVPDFITLTVSVTGEADAKTRFILYEADGTIAYDTSTLLALLPTSGWLVQGESVTIQVQKGQYAWGVNTVDVLSDVNTFDLDITPAAHIDFTSADLSQNSLPTTYDFLTDKAAVFDIGISTPPPTCVPVAISGSPSMPNGQVGVPYSYSYVITGSSPFFIDNVTKPSWMTLTVSQFLGDWIVTANGTPDADGTGITVSYDINNDCGEVAFSDTIDIAVNNGLITINYDYTETSAPFGALRFYVNSVLVLIVTSTDTGFIQVNPGDVVEARVMGSAVNDATMIVEDSVFGIIYSTSGAPPLSFSFNATAGRIYDVIATITA